MGVTITPERSGRSAAPRDVRNPLPGPASSVLVDGAPVPGPEPAQPATKARSAIETQSRGAWFRATPWMRPMRLPRSPAAKFHQDSAEVARMEEGDLGAVASGSRRPVDQRESGGLGLGERRAHVVHEKREVMDPLAALLQEAGYRSVGAGRLEQFDHRVAGTQERELQAHRFQRLGAFMAKPQGARPPIDGRGERAHRDSHVSEPLDHWSTPGWVQRTAIRTTPSTIRYQPNGVRPL